MYHESLFSVTKTDDDKYILSFHVKTKKDKKSDMCMMDREEKIYVADTAKDLTDLLTKLLPDMDASGMEEDKFAKAFGEATKKGGKSDD